MGCFIVVEVEDDDTAKALILKLNQGSRWRVVGLFARPKHHCQHQLGSGYDDRKQVARGSKFGWWVHNVKGCKRPRRGSHQLANMIDVEDYPLDPDSEYTQKVSTLHVFDVVTSKMLRQEVEPA